MKANKKAIAVAKDVLAHLRTLQLKPGRYLHLKEDDTHLRQLARVYDALDMGTFRILEDGCDETKTRRSLEDVFDSKTMDLMEAAFERHHFEWAESADTSEIEAAIAFGKRYRSVRKRVRAVMENIIANKGYFKPEKAEAKV